MLTEILASNNENALSKKINKFLHEIENDQVIDIKFSTSSMGEKTIFAAMIIYKKSSQ
jgi:hypothetical protein